MLDFAKKNKIILGDWYKEPVVPVSNLNTVNYAYGSCPQAEKSCQTIINLPTYPLLNVKDIDKIVKVIKNA